IISFDEKMHHGGISCGFDITPSETYVPGEDIDYHLLPFEIARLTNERYHSDDIRGNFGKMTLEENSRAIAPSVLVRSCDIKEAGQAYSGNVLPAKSSYEGSMKDASAITQEELQTYLADEIKSWEENGFSFTSECTVDETGKITLSVDKGNSSHIAAGGPNPHVILANVLHRIEEKTDIVSASTNGKPLYASATSRVLERDYDAVQETVVENMKEIAQQALRNLNLVDKVSVEFGVKGGVRPVLNGARLVEQADALLKEADVVRKDICIPIAAGESFSTYKRFLKPGEEENSFYFHVGALKKEIADELMEKKTPIPSHTEHHSDDFYVQDSALPYGILVVGFALEFAKQFLKEHKEN
ncbi:MAG: hypothetical protein RIT04_422, partial [Candidatus Parcubacteria bacterium]